MNHTSFRQAAEILKTAEFSAFADTVRTAFAKNHRVNFTGTGDAGRLAIRLERAWRKASARLMAQYPQASQALEEQLSFLRHVDIAGEYSVIATPAHLPQSNIFGRGMMRATGVASANRDTVICIDPTGDTPSTLGSAHFALIHLAPMYLFTCVEPDPEKNRSTREVYTHPNCKVLTVADLHMVEILCAVALEASLWDILEAAGVPNGFPGYGWFADNLAALPSVSPLAYAGSTLCADENLLDALCFAAEHPRFRVRNPNRETAEAWERCFLRQPRCLEWTADFYQSLGFSKAQIKDLPNLTAKGLTQIPIGKESLVEQNTLMVDTLMVDTLLDGCDLPKTNMEIFQHITLRLLLQTLVN